MAFDIDNVPGYGPAQPRDTASAERVRAGKGPSQAPAKADAELGIDEGPQVATGHDARRTLQGRNDQIATPEARAAIDAQAKREDPIANDPLAAGVLAGTVAGGAGTLVAEGAAALGAPPIVAATASGAAGGAVANKLQEGSAAQGALAGGALGALSGLMRTVTRQGVAAVSKETPGDFGAGERLAGETHRQYGQAAAGAGKAKTLAKLAAISPDDFADTLTRNGVGSIENAVEAKAATAAALAKQGQAMGNALDVIGTAPVKSTVGDVGIALSKAIKELRTGPKADIPVADALHTWSKNFVGANGGAPSAALTPAELQQAISALESKGYGGMSATLSPSSAAKAARIAARAVNDVLDDHVAAAVKGSPEMAQAAQALKDATHDYRILKTVQPIVTNRAVAETFAPTAAQRAAANVAHPAAAAQKVIAAIPGKMVGGADTLLAKLFAARAAGAVPIDMLDQALKAGISPAIVQGLFQRPQQGQQ